MRGGKPRFRRLAAAGLLLGLAVTAGAVVQLAAVPLASAATTQFHGVNWADPNDNFITRENVPVGLSLSDSYATVYTKSTAILKGFQGLGANTVRFGINTWTTSSSWWNSLIAAYDAANALGMNVVIAPWLEPRVGLETAGDQTAPSAGRTAKVISWRMASLPSN